MVFTYFTFAGHNFASGADLPSLVHAIEQHVGRIATFFWLFRRAEDVWSKDFLSIVSQILTLDPTQRPSAQMIFDLAGCRPSQPNSAIRAYFGSVKLSLLMFNIYILHFHPFPGAFF